MVSLSFIKKLGLVCLIFIQYVNSQSNLGINNCAAAVGVNQPTKAEECYADKNDPKNNCCFVTATIQNVRTNLCYLLPKGADVSNVNQIASNWGANATILCSSQYISLAIINLCVLLILAF
jgi:hypothetical protein